MTNQELADIKAWAKKHGRGTELLLIREVEELTRERDALWEQLQLWREGESAEPDGDLCDFMDRWMKARAALGDEE
jgi:hypothetical protein